MKTINYKEMKNIVKVAAVAVLAVSALATTSCSKSKYAKDCTLKNDVDTFSYALGFFEAKGITQMFERAQLFDTIYMEKIESAFGEKLAEGYVKTRHQQFDTLDIESFLYGFHHSIRFGKGKITEDAANLILDSRFNSVRERKQAEAKEKAAAEIVKGQEFLAEKEKEEGVIKTESGLLYKVVTMGTGKKPVDGDKVKVLYTGKLIDGTIFDSTANRDNEPTEFPINRVIKGWTEVLKLMPVGSKFTAYIPSELGYGERGAGENIPGNATLIFDIELLDIVK